jgi:hypothetical protein
MTDEPGEWLCGWCRACFHENEPMDPRDRGDSNPWAIRQTHMSQCVPASLATNPDVHLGNGVVVRMAIAIKFTSIRVLVLPHRYRSIAHRG